jgi:hypothetical protein
MNRNSILRIVAGTAAIIVAVILVTWALGGFTGMSGAGDVALILGIAVTLALGIGLMTLVFYSSRSERDEAVRGAGEARGMAGAKPSGTPRDADQTRGGPP